MFLHLTERSIWVNLMNREDKWEWQPTSLSQNMSSQFWVLNEPDPFEFCGYLLGTDDFKLAGGHCMLLNHILCVDPKGKPIIMNLA